MQSWLAAVGLVPSRPSQTAAYAEVKCDPCPAAEVRGLLPDFVEVAAATESGIVSIQEEARSLETASLPVALMLWRRWSSSLRKRPRADDNLASFRAQFLRSSALETSLEALRRNKPLCSVLRNALAISEVLDSRMGDAPPNNNDETGPQAAVAELCQFLQQCLPRAAATFVRPALSAVLSTEADGCAVAAMTAISKLKEEWTEVVRSQSIRGLERRLDSLTYELQKRPMSRHNSDDKFRGADDRPPTALTLAQRQTSHDNVIVLAALCEALAAATSQTEERAREATTTLGDLASALEQWAAPADDSARSSAVAACCTSRPGPADCEMAVAAMSMKTMSGVSRGLFLLGLPRSPLRFTPGVEFQLRGHDVQEHINAMIECWLAGNMDGFYKMLQQVKDIVQEDQTIGSEVSQGIVEINLDDSCREKSTLLARRAVLVANRKQLLAQLQELDSELDSLDEQLGYSRQSSCPSGTSSTQAPSSAHSERTSPSPGSECSERSGNGCDHHQQATEHLVSDLVPPSARAVAREISMQACAMSELLSCESSRCGERLRCQLHQRQMQLLVGLACHLNFEGTYLSSMMPCGAAARSGRPLTTESVETAKNRVHELVKRLETTLPGACLIPEVPSVAARCRAKWMDGDCYDAEVQCALGDGTILVNWLRALPDLDLGYPLKRGETVRKPLVTVGERGGDDTLHRIVLQEDVWLVGDGSINMPPKRVQAAQDLFNSRSPEDLLCADCNRQDSDWASISFGTYLCALCADVHKNMGSRKSLLRPLDDGWGWSVLDLAPLRLGGNSAFHERLEDYPAVRDLAAAERYSSRFAEYYRRYLDALCANIPPPAPPPVETAADPASGDFVSAPEAAASAYQATKHFMATAVAARERLPAATCRGGRSGSVPRARGGIERRTSSTGQYADGL